MPAYNATADKPRTKKNSLRTIFLPNSSPVPNWFFDEVLQSTEIPHAARSVLLFLLRKTIGWDNRVEELSLVQIQEGAAVTRPTAIHALRVICDLWELFHRTRGRKGQHSSVYAVGDMSREHFIDRCNLVSLVYETDFPSPAQLQDAARVAMDERRPFKEIIERIFSMRVAEEERRACQK
jgi:hypothetical protein